MSRVVIDRAVVEQALEALEYAQQGRECPSTTRQAITALRAALAAQGCYITQDMTRQEYERLYPDADSDVEVEVLQND